MITSGIQAWTQENIKLAPLGKGIFALRNSPINGSILILDKTNNLNEVLENIYSNQTYAGVQFFEWYQIDPIEDLEKVFSELKLKYHFESH